MNKAIFVTTVSGAVTWYSVQQSPNTATIQFNKCYVCSFKEVLNIKSIKRA